MFHMNQALAGGEEATRDKIADKYKWDVTDLYKTEADWQAKKAELEAKLDGFEQYKGKLAESADNLYNCLDFGSDVIKEYFRLSSYASRISDVDTREAGPLAMSQ